MPQKTRAVGLIAAGVFVLTACGSPDSGGGSAGTSVTLTAQDFSFDPGEIKVEAGQTVEITLDNQGDAEHSFTADDLDAEVEAEGGESASTTFTAPDSEEEVEFHCKYHPDQMTGTILVGEETSAGTGEDDSEEEPKEEDPDY